MVLIICTKNELNLTNRWTDKKCGPTERMDGRSQNYIPPTSSGDNKCGRGPLGDASDKKIFEVFILKIYF